MVLRWLLVLICAWWVSVSQAAVPDIPLQTLDGQPRNVNEYIGKGKWVIVALWAHDCRICAGEAAEISAFHNAHQAKDAMVLGVSLDGAGQIDQARAFASRHKLPFVNLVAEPEEAVIMQFGGGRFVGTPTHYFFDPVGRIVGRKIGPISGEDIEAFMDAFNKSKYAVPSPAAP